MQLIEMNSVKYGKNVSKLKTTKNNTGKTVTLAKKNLRTITEKCHAFH